MSNFLRCTTGAECCGSFVSFCIMTECESPKQIESTAAPQTLGATGNPPVRHDSVRTTLKLKNAIQDAQILAAELQRAASQANFTIRSRGEANAAQDRSISRYRNEASIVSFTDPSLHLRYSPEFMPGVHFFTFLASKAPTVQVPPLNPPSSKEQTEQVQAA